MNKMQIEVFDPHPRRLVPNSEKIVSALQNSTLHPLDLLVRESVQNSLDAALGPDNKDYNVSIAFRRGNFDPEAFAAKLDAVSEGAVLDCVRKYGESIGTKYLAIRDANCVGLTGDPRDGNSNIYKLIYGFLDGKGASLAEGAEGGSVGVGKTVFLHFGVGFVIYYSRTKDGSHRLAMFYCKNRNDIKLFNRSHLPFQLAWWGKPDWKDVGAVLPIEDKDFIKEFLSIFGLSPYSERESGTTIIIPFFDGVPPAHDDVTGFKPWTKSVDAYLRYSVMKWYAPRYRGDLAAQADEDGTEFRKYHWTRYLKCVFPDGNTIQSGMSPEELKIFGLIRDLYDIAVGEKRVPDDVFKFAACSQNVPSNDPPLYFQNNVMGWMAIKKINYVSGEFANTETLLKSLAPGESIADRKGFVLYCRRPGMIMSYDETWDRVLSGAKCEAGEFIIGIFVVNSENYLLDDNHERGCQLDQLFRETEKSDHYGWPLAALSHGFKLINRIVGQLRGGVSEFLGAQDQLPQTMPDSDMSRGLGSIFMDGRNGFGGTPNCVEGNGGVESIDGSAFTSKRQLKKSSVLVGEYSLSALNGGVKACVPIEIKVAKGDRKITLDVAVEADGRPMTLADWEETDGGFPLKIMDFEVEVGTLDKTINEKDSSCLLSIPESERAVKGVLSFWIENAEMVTLVRRRT